MFQEYLREKKNYFNAEDTQAQKLAKMTLDDLEKLALERQVDSIWQMYSNSIMKKTVVILALKKSYSVKKKFK